MLRVKMTRTVQIHSKQTFFPHHKHFFPQNCFYQLFSENISGIHLHIPCIVARFGILGCPYFDAILGRLVGHVLSEGTAPPEWNKVFIYSDMGTRIVQDRYNFDPFIPYISDLS